MPEAGDLVSARFRLLERIGAGGMGAVFRARDEVSGDVVAVKVLLEATADEGPRFVREASILGSLAHPSIVRHVAHGEENGQLFLAMEWLEGEDLASRLARGPLSIADTLAIGEAIADALAAAHAAGVVHRDIKPANVFIAPGLSVRVLDFGIARASLPNQPALTKTGALIGTPSYMAPEQASGAPITHAVDLFALGCVLFECATGVLAFGGETVMAVLAKILVSEAPRVSSMREVPVGLDELVAALLSKAPGDRPRSALEVRDRIRRLRAESLRPPAPRAIGEIERRVVSVVAGTSTRPDMAQTLPSLAPATAPALESHADLRTLPDGSIVCVFRGAVARDEAAAAVRYALALAKARPELALGVATGRATIGGAPSGEAIDRAVEMIAGASPGRVWLDEATADLVSDRIELVRGAAIEAREGAHVEQERLVLGRKTPCVGRAKELAFLRALRDESAENEVARAALITAPPGAGKSRLRRELMKDTPRAWIARAEPGSESRAFGLVVQLARQGTPSDDPFVATFVAELTGVELADPHPWLAAARGDPSLMTTHQRRAIDLWMAEQLREPLSIVLEDLHWGDDESVAAIDRWLFSLKDRPLTVIALARPELRARWPKLWSSHDVPEIKLGPIPRAACEKLAKEVLPELDADALRDVVSACGGHPLLLEELLRARDAGDAKSASLEALLEARLMRLKTAERRIVRAASVLGERFSIAGVAVVAGSDPLEVMRALEIAEADEIVGQSADPSERVFLHALVRDAAYAMLTDDDRRAAHRAAARWLGAIGDRAHIAEHLELGAETDEQRLAAIHAWLRLGEIGDPPTAVRALRRAQRSLGELAPTPARDAAELTLCEIQGRRSLRTDRGSAVSVIDRWIALARSLDRRSSLAHALSTRVLLYASDGDFERARATRDEANATLPDDAPPEVRQLVASATSALAYYEGDLEASLASDLSILAGEDVHPRTIALCAHNAADLSIRLGRLDEGERLLERSIAVARENGIALFDFSNGVTRAFLACLRGDDRIAELEAAVEKARRLGERWVELETQLLVGLACAVLGRPAREVLEALSAAARESGHHRLSQEAADAVAAIDHGERPWFRGGRHPEEAG